MINTKINAFLLQSYQDAWTEYEYSLKSEHCTKWDWVIITASNEKQAQAYRVQIQKREQQKKLPMNTKFVIIPDPDGKRVGSGGATFNVMKYIRKYHASFKGLKILVIHSGGDSKRVPQYSACGKLFSPVPRKLPDGRRSTLFDEFIIGLTGVPDRLIDGMLICSGDVLLLFNPLQIDFYSKGAAAISIKEVVEIGENHGVFLGDEHGNLDMFLHKQSVHTLSSNGAVDNNGNVDIDTGSVIFESTLLDDMYTLIDTDEKFDEFVNEKVRLSFYGDFLYPLGSSCTFEQYLEEKAENDYTDALAKCRKKLWEVINPYNMKLIRFSPAIYIHFGTTRELLSLMTSGIRDFRFLGWKNSVNTNNENSNFATSNAYVHKDSVVGNGSYIEDSYINKSAQVGENCVISGVTLNDVCIPDNTVLHGLKLKNGEFVVRIYHIDDNPKQNMWFMEPLDQPLWEKPLFIPCKTMEDGVKKTLLKTKGDNLLSLQESFNRADTEAIIDWQDKLSDFILVKNFIACIEKRIHVDETIKIFNNGISNRAKELLLAEADVLNIRILSEFSTKTRIYYYLAALCDGQEKEQMMDLYFSSISNAVLEGSIESISYNPNFRINKQEVITKLPVRANWGGGWSDTPPYCLEHGGTVLNAAIKLSGDYPIESVVKKIDGDKFILTSADYDSYREFTNIKELQDCSNPNDPFALHKAALIGCGVIPIKGNISLQSICKKLGGGIYLSTQVINIPRGSGLGTSSILAAACVKGIFEIMGEKLDDSELYYRVLCVEQFMTTGGGWQDQVGGIVKGIKLVSSNKGLNQEIRCTKLNIGKETVDELNQRFCIIYTGQRRIARNLLRNIMGNYIGCQKDVVDILYKIQQLAVLMRLELEKGNIDGLSSLFNEHWDLSKRLDKGCTNACIDSIFDSIDDLISGRMICGAGGGGFLQVILKKDVTEDQLNRRIEQIFGDCGVKVWDCELTQ